MEGDGNAVGNKVKKSTGSRRTWNQQEEIILMEQLKELVKSPNWKTENDFRPGYLQKLAEKMREKLLGTDICATPHIHSRITIWKRHHGCLQTALGDSGGGFNSITKIIDVSDTACAKAVKKEPTIAGMRYKPWPFYYDWLEVFGYDRANGKVSEDVIYAVNELVSDDSQTDFADPVPTEVTPNQNVDGSTPCDMEVENRLNVVEGAKTTKSNPKKRPFKAQPPNHIELFDGLAVLFKDSDDRLQSMVQGIGVDSHGVKCRENLFSLLNVIPDLTLDECFDASENLINNPRHLDLFFGFPVDARPHYVRRLLNGEFDTKTG